MQNVTEHVTEVLLALKKMQLLWKSKMNIETEFMLVIYEYDTPFNLFRRFITVKSNKIPIVLPINFLLAGKLPLLNSET